MYGEKRKAGRRCIEMKEEILFIHSAGPQGYHEGSNYLVTYLQHNLGPAYEIVFPEMPDPENPRYKSWRRTLNGVFDSVEDDLILVGHSLGASVLLKYLSEEKVERKIKGLFLIGAIHWGKEEWNVEEYTLNKNFSERLPDIPNIFLYHSNDDEVVPITHLHYYAEELPYAITRELSNRGHLFGKGFPELVEDIKKLETHD
jgi:uncharacterized protein